MSLIVPVRETHLFADQAFTYDCNGNRPQLTASEDHLSTHDRESVVNRGAGSVFFSFLMFKTWFLGTSRYKSPFSVTLPHK